MASRVVMPKLTDTMEEGVVVKWKKHEGDAVQAGDVLAEIETDKAVMDLEAFAPGILRKTVVNEGDTVKAGALIGVIGEAEEDITAALSDSMTAGSAPSARPPTTPEKEKTPLPSPSSAAGPAQQESRPVASPRARSLASERGVDLSTVKGSGPGGRIIEEDVLKEAGTGSPTAAKSTSTDQPLSQMRKAIARATTQSKAPVPHFYLTTDIDMLEAEQLRSQFKQARNPHPSVTDMIVKAVALALSRHPEINVSYADDKLRRHHTIDIGIAVGLDDGLISPVLRDCGEKTLAQISQEAHDLIERTRNRQLKPEEYTGATCTVSNLGMYDVENFIAVLMPPEAAAIAIGAIRNVPIVEGDTVKAGRRMKVTLSCDHRALDGVQGAKFLKEFKRILEHPLEMILQKEMQ
ncbi:MAG: dihydrolipoamide acetyltransferase family protein [Nitrospiraceae bacterium]